MIKIFKASFYYSQVIKKLYEVDTELSKKSYIDQYNALQSISFGWSDIWKKELESIGTYKVEEVVTNNEFLQKKWAEENNIKYNDYNWILEILEAQILAFQPNILFAQDYSNLTSDFLRKLKKKCPSIKLTMSWDGILLNDKKLFSECDLILSCVPSVCDYYRNNGINSYYMRFFFDKGILAKIKPNNNLHDFSFVGSLSPYNGLHNQRIAAVKELSCKTSLKVWSPDPPEHGLIYKYPQRKRLLTGKFKEFWETYNLGKRWQGSVFGVEMYQVLADSKITFNMHIDKVPDFAANIRLWEATGVGTCLITDWKKNLKDIFEPDMEIVTYKSVEECIEMVFLLNNDGKRNEIAKAGQKRTIENYSAKIALRDFDQYLKSTFYF